MTARLLAPLGALYGAATAGRMARPGQTMPVPVICVGNLVVGGAGKTPVALALAALMAQAGWRPAFLSRGYGRAHGQGAPPEPIRVDLEWHDARLVGDEPLLLASVAPTYVAADRAAAGQRAVAEGATLLILDDGLQNPALAKTLSLAVVDGRGGAGNGLCLPAGPLRAPLRRQWPFVSGVCLVGSGEAGARVAAEALELKLPVWATKLIPEPAAVRSLRGSPLYAFAGIGRPEKFFATLREAGLELCGRECFADHHAFSAQDLARLRAAAEARGARLVTTTKDRVRLPSDFPAVPLPVSLSVEDEPAFAAWVMTALARAT